MTEMQRIARIPEGMDVYDVQGGRVGQIGFVHYGADSSTAAHGVFNADTIPPTALALLEPGKVTRDARERMLRYGFAQIKTGILWSDRVVELHDIAKIDDAVRLSVRKDELQTI